MLYVRDRLALLVALACLAGYAWLWHSSGYASGYQDGAQLVVDEYDVKTTGLCQAGWRWERCARTTTGEIVLFRGLR